MKARLILLFVFLFSLVSLSAKTNPIGLSLVEKNQDTYLLQVTNNLDKIIDIKRIEGV